MQIGTIPVRVGPIVISDYEAISASQQSWSLGLAELGKNSVVVLMGIHHLSGFRG